MRWAIAIIPGLKNRAKFVSRFSRATHLFIANANGIASLQLVVTVTRNNLHVLNFKIEIVFNLTELPSGMGLSSQKRPCRSLKPNHRKFKRIKQCWPAFSWVKIHQIHLKAHFWFALEMWLFKLKRINFWPILALKDPRCLCVCVHLKVGSTYAFSTFNIFFVDAILWCRLLKHVATHRTREEINLYLTRLCLQFSSNALLIKWWETYCRAAAAAAAAICGVLNSTEKLKWTEQVLIYTIHYVRHYVRLWLTQILHVHTHTHKIKHPSGYTTFVVILWDFKLLYPKNEIKFILNKKKTEKKTKEWNHL